MTSELPLKQKHPTCFSSVSRLFPDWPASAAPSCPPCCGWGPAIWELALWGRPGIPGCVQLWGVGEEGRECGRGRQRGTLRRRHLVLRAGAELRSLSAAGRDQVLPGLGTVVSSGSLKSTPLLAHLWTVISVRQARTTSRQGRCCVALDWGVVGWLRLPALCRARAGCERCVWVWALENPC